MHSFIRRLASAALLACSGAAGAAPVVLFSQGPFTTVDAVGAVQVDGGFPVPLAQRFSVSTGSTLEQIVVWGATKPAVPTDPDNFQLTLGASTLDVLSVLTEADGALTKYTLDVVDTLLTASSLSLLNNVTSFEWYWVNASDQPYISDDTYLAAFSLLGSLAPTGTELPEPNTLLLIGLAAAGGAFASRRRNAG